LEDEEGEEGRREGSKVQKVGWQRSGDFGLEFWKALHKAEMEWGHKAKERGGLKFRGGIPIKIKEIGAGGEEA
jgi:hypothetical protein